MTYLNSDIKDIGETSPGHIFALREDDRLEDAIDQLTLSLAGYELAELPDERHEHSLEVPENPEGFKDAPALTYTARLRSLLPAFISQLYAMFSIDHVERGAAARLSDLRRLLGGLFKAEKQNYTASLVHAVENNPELQSQIREDLGGEAAMRRWENRRDKLRGLGPDMDPQSQDITAARPCSGKPRQIATDRTGLFRLAALTSERPSDRQAVNLSKPAPTQSLRLRAPAPIGLTPDQLRPRANSPCKAPSIRRLQKTWDAMQSEHYFWDLLLMIAGLMTISRDFRKAYAPP